MELTCPVCGLPVRHEFLAANRITCESCGTELAKARFRGYKWLRFGVCFGIAVAICWRKHWGSFTIFVVSSYALPLLFFWDLQIARFFPIARLVPVSNL